MRQKRLVTRRLGVMPVVMFAMLFVVGPRPGAAASVSGDEEGRPRRHLPRHQSAGSLSLARGRQLAETTAWVEAQNKVTFPVSRADSRSAQQLQTRVKELNDYEKYSAPSRKGPYYFFSKNDGLQNQSVLYIQKGLDGAPEVLIDPNTWSTDGTVARSARSCRRKTRSTPSTASRSSGSDWQEYKVMELATKKTLPDTVEWVKVSGVAWHGDGFYYSRYPAPAKGKEKASINENHQVYFHKSARRSRRTCSSIEDADNPQRFHIVETTEDERFAVLTVSDRGKGKDGNALFVRDLSRGRARVHAVIATIGDDTFGVIDNVGDKLLVETNRKAPNWRVVLVDPAQARRGELEDGPAGEAGAAQSVTHGRRQAVRDVSEGRDDAGVRLQPRRQARDEVALPGPASPAGSAATADDTFVFYTFNSLNVPPTIYRYDIATRRARSSASRRCRATTRTRSRPSRSSTRARTARRSRCSSSTRRA